MKSKTSAWTVGVGLLIVAAAVRAQAPNHAAKDDRGAGDRAVSSPDSLNAEIEGLRPAKIAWREIQWKTCLLEGLKESREKKKPVLLWVVGPGENLEGRC